jgi:hypothetical protein
MTADHFEATFVLSIDRDTAWKRLTEHPVESTGGATGYWVPGFDASVTTTDEQPGRVLRGTKDDEPCAGTDIVVTLEADATGTRITVVQSGFGDWLAARYEWMAIGWRHIVADLQAYLATGVHARRHLRPWGDLGANVSVANGGLLVAQVRDGALAAALGLRTGDLLVSLAGAPVSSLDDLVTVLRVIGSGDSDVEAEWIREGELRTSTAAT